MKTLTKTIAATALIFAIAAPAAAAVSSDINKAVNQAAGPGSNVFVNVDDSGTVTLTGYVSDIYVIDQVEQAAIENGASDVNNHVIRPR